MTEQEFEQHIKRLSPRIFKMASRKATPRNDADDLYQDAVIRLWMQRNTFGNRGSFDHWALKVARNTMNNTLYCKLPRTVNFSAMMERSDKLIPSATDFESVLCERAYLRDLFNRIPIHYQQFILMDAQGYSYAEMSTKLNISVLAIRKRMWDARQITRQWKEATL